MIKLERPELIELRESGFRCKGRQYSYDDIRHIWLHRVKTTHRINLVNAGETEAAYLLITMDDSKIKVSVDQMGIFMPRFRNRKGDIKSLLDMYALLSNVTFLNRLRPYEDQIRARGFFQYDECRFYVGDRIVFRERQFPISESRSGFFRHYGFIQLGEPDGFFGSGKVPGFDTRTDADVIFYLLRQYFGLTWKDPSTVCAECGQPLEASDSVRVVQGAQYHESCVTRKVVPVYRR